MSPLPSGRLELPALQQRLLRLQAMFMRNRAHMCNYCSTIDEAHYKRHHELVVQLRSIYENCGEVDGTIVPAEPGDPRRGRSVDPLPGDSKPDSGLTPEETPVSKRERKDVKCLFRAASRAKVVTQEEIKYVDSVLHNTEGISSNDLADPANLENLQLIEAHLRYDANVYNHHASRQDLRKFAAIPNFDVDFDAEMERVLDTFRITELAKRNLRNRGLQGKELKDFDVSVENFKAAVVEDLVLVKKDTMEIRMRRAGYLRYTSKTAYQIVEDRYTDKDWKTGERITSSSSDSSSLTSSTDEPVTISTYVPASKSFVRYTDYVRSEYDDTASMPVVHSTQDADRRHLEHVHIRISGHDGLVQTVIEPYHAPLLPMTPNVIIKKPAVLQLKVVDSKENKEPAEVTSRDWLRHDTAWQTISSRSLHAAKKKGFLPPSSSTKPKSSKKSDMAIKPVHASGSISPAKHLSLNASSLLTLNPTVGVSKVASSKSGAPAVQAPTDEGLTSLKGPDRAFTPRTVAEDAHPIVSQKKAKKMQRETRRKAKKLNDTEQSSSPSASADIYRREAQHAPHGIPPSALKADEDFDAEGEKAAHIQGPELGAQMGSDKIEPNLSNVVLVPKKDNMSESSAGTTTPILRYTTHGKHNHWTRFARVFIVDQLTVPLLQYFEGCSHGSSCHFESHGIPDCPFHEPHCPCGDPLRNLCCLLYPDKHILSAGPYNRAHGERMMSIYEQHEQTKGRVILMDDDIASYFMGKTDPNGMPDYASMPARLLREHTEFQKGYERGPLMKQELSFRRMYLKNAAIDHPLTMRVLQGIQYEELDDKGSLKQRHCYCDTEIYGPLGMMQKSKEILVECSFRDCEFGGVFHKRCVKNLGAHKVSRWYCTACEKEMKIVAHKALKVCCDDDDTVVGRAKKTADIMDKASSVVGLLKSRLQDLYTKKPDDELDVEDVD
ncbi:hypothetical protein N0V95_009100 [Ascochyta clinopodiicola]|nr:hypothetical protein N0V95_009100 [Ascochyta clinopodiicola]